MRALRILASAALLLVLALDAAAGNHEKARLDSLFAALKQTATADEARPIEAAIWVLWTSTGNPETDSLMARGISAMQAGAFGEALSVFDGLVEAAPDLAEAWNKRATLHYLMDNYEASVADIQKTLELEPRHFGALSGLGLIYMAIGKEDAALKAFEKALSFHPHLPGPSKFVEDIRRKKDGSAI